MVAQTFAGLEEVLASELLKLGAANITPERRAVSFYGDLGFMYKANFCCRTAIRILKPIAEFDCPDEEALYTGMKRIDWTKLMDVSDTFLIDAVCFNSKIDHTHFASLKAKDAIADQFRETKQARPNIDKENPTLKIHIHIVADKCKVSLDSSGDQLFKRGYRLKTNEAPLNEVLAAGLILMTGWDKHSNFLDPMCGSGTLPIEAAMIAGNIPAGYYRESFAFQKWNDFDDELWQVIVDSALNKIIEFDHEVIASDISSKSIEITNTNIKNAHLHKDITVVKKSFQDFDPPKGRTTVVMNPPYGERLKLDDSISFYQMIGNILKKKYENQNVWVLAADNESYKYIGLKPTKKIRVFNGALECYFLKFELYTGSRNTN